MIQRRCRAMIVQDDSEVSVINGNIEQAEDGNKSAMIQVDIKKKRFINKETQSFK